jgi:hypothetical protein
MALLSGCIPLSVYQETSMITLLHVAVYPN